jgi:hypothetical protein
LARTATPANARDARSQGEVPLEGVAAPIRDDEVLDAVVRVAWPRDEVVHLGGAGDPRVAVEAAVVLDITEWPAHGIQRDTTDSEEELLEPGILDERPVEASNHGSPSPLDERSQEPGELH